MHERNGAPARRRCARFLPSSRKPLCRHCRTVSHAGPLNHAAGRALPTRIVLLEPRTCTLDGPKQNRPATGRLSVYYCARCPPSVSVSDGVVDLSCLPGRSWGVERMHPGITCDLQDSYEYLELYQRNGSLRFIILRGGSPLQERGGPERGRLPLLGAGRTPFGVSGDRPCLLRWPPPRSDHVDNSILGGVWAWGRRVP